MSSLGDGLGKLFGGDASFGQQLAALKTEYGTVTALAKHLGVDRRTIQRWESGKIRAPKADHRETVGRNFREAKSKGSVPGDRTVTVGFTQQGKGGRDRQRKVDGAKLDLEPGTMDKTRRAYIVGGKEAAAAAFVDGIGDGWYHDQFEDDVRGEEVHADSTSDPTPTGVSVN